MSTTDTEVKKDQPASADEGVKKDQQAPADKGIDYKAELERVEAEKLQLEQEKNNYRTGMLNAKDQLKKKSRKGSDEEGDIDNDESDIDEKVKAIVAEQMASLKGEMALNSFESIVSEYSSDPDEQKLIKYHFENSTAGGSVRERIENAKLIANKKAFERERGELMFALKAKSGVSKFSTAGGSNLDVEKASAGKEIFSPEVIAQLVKRGLDPKKVEENYLKLKAKGK